MSQVAISGNASGTGTLTIASPNTNSNYTLTLPTATTTIVGTDATQTLTNKTIQGGAITSGTAVASTSGTSIDFTSIPSWVKRVTVMFSGVSLSSNSTIRIRLGTGATPTFTTTGYITFGTTTAASSVAGATDTGGFVIGVNQTASGVTTYGGNCIITNVNSNDWSYLAIMGGSSTTNGGQMGGGSVSLAAALTAIRVTTVSGTDTFDAGTVNIMYEG